MFEGKKWPDEFVRGIGRGFRKNRRGWVFIGLQWREGSGMDGRGLVRVKGGCKLSSRLVGLGASEAMAAMDRWTVRV